MEEVWIPVGAHPRYLVSDRGRVQNRSSGRVLRPVIGRCGYPQVNLDGKTVFIHRLVGLHFVPNPRGLRELDHRDGDHRNNRAENLLWATRGENAANRRCWSSTGFKGVSRVGNRWRSVVAGRYLGYFPTAEDAARAYDTAARLLYGEFARPNFSDPDSE